MITAEVLNGLGRHEYYLEPKQRRMFQAIGWADWIQTFITLCMTKVSICLFLLRIVDSRGTRIAMYSTIGFTVLFTTVCVALFLGICRPLKAYWDVGVNGVCLSDDEVKNIVIAQGGPYQTSSHQFALLMVPVLSVITDLICASFPIIVLRNLQVKSSTKIGLCILMGLGVITAVCCTVRTALSGVMTDYDITWGITTNVGWRLPEVNIGIVCANAPVLRPLYLWSRGKLVTQKSSSAGFSKEPMWPSNGMKYDGSTKLRDPVSWEGTTEHTSTSMEMGLPMHDNKIEGGV